MAGINQVTVDTLERVLAAFNTHDIDAVMSFFADDCVLEMPGGPDLALRGVPPRDGARR